MQSSRDKSRVTRKSEAYRDKSKVYEGYAKFLEFEKAVYEKRALSGSTIVINRHDKRKFEQEWEFVEQDIDMHQNCLKKIANLLQSGLFPSDTKILLYVSPRNEDFKLITTALKSGKCPINFKLNFFFDLDVFITNMNNEITGISELSRGEFDRNWVPHLIDAYQSNKCPIGLHVDLFGIEHDKSFREDLHNAKRTYHLWEKYQKSTDKMVEFFQGVNNNTSILCNMPHEVIKLICEYVIVFHAEKIKENSLEFRNNIRYVFVKDNHFYPTIKINGAIKFLEVFNAWDLKFGSWNSSFFAKQYQLALTEILDSNLNLNKKVININHASHSLFTRKLNKDNYTQSRAIKTALHCKLIDKKDVEVNPENEDEFKLSTSFTK